MANTRQVKVGRKHIAIKKYIDKARKNWKGMFNDLGGGRQQDDGSDVSIYDQ